MSESAQDAYAQLISLLDRHAVSYRLIDHPPEGAFAKFKEMVRRAAARTREALEQAVADAWAQITAEDLRGFFRHRGYRLVTDLDQLLCS